MRSRNIIVFFIVIQFFSCEANKKQNQMAPYEEMLTILIQNNGRYIKDTDVISSKEDTTSLYDVIEKLSFVIYIPTIGCSSCSERESQVMKKFLSEEAQNRVVIVGRFNNVREQKLFENQIGIKTYNISDKSSDFPLPDLKKKNLAFIMTDEGTAFSFFEMSRNNDLTGIYYTNISKVLSAYNEKKGSNYE